MRVGVFGGTFDPIHVGHLIVAQEVRFRCALDRVLFVPAGTPPHKPGQVVAPAAHRVAMLELALDGNPAFAISPVEIARPGPSYSVETLELLRRELGAAVELFFILGTDQLSDLATWHRPRDLVALCSFIVVERPGAPWDESRVAVLEQVLPGLTARLARVPVPHIDIAGREVRRRVLAGEPIRYLVPDPVREYIASHSLYDS